MCRWSGTAPEAAGAGAGSRPSLGWEQTPACRYPHPRPPTSFAGHVLYVGRWHHWLPGKEMGGVLFDSGFGCSRCSRCAMADGRPLGKVTRSRAGRGMGHRPCAGASAAAECVMPIHRAAGLPVVSAHPNEPEDHSLVCGGWGGGRGELGGGCRHGPVAFGACPCSSGCVVC